MIVADVYFRDEFGNQYIENVIGKDYEEITDNAYAISHKVSMFVILNR